MSQPTNITELKRFFGIVNFFRKFIPNLADMAEPLHAMLKADATWTPNQEKAFERIKECLSYHPVLSLYDCKKSVYLSADASSYGIGSMLYQIQDSSKRPITHTSKTLSATRAGPIKSGAWCKVDLRGLETNFVKQNNLLHFAIHYIGRLKEYVKMINI
ncbi:Transposon Tf2-9 polyprotein [Araneus ventricosus]|uniref:RNA-directed DNA polymerase n=1 Tax=Araneus ventricosus TaxID=182803 RepID=A0A4Y2REW7_ARAVE|nr:Transposon Tf2-9 polyprotein [Araneus ventricosus]